MDLSHPMERTLDQHLAVESRLLEWGAGRPHAARMYDYYLGGKDHYAADRKSAEEALDAWPAARTAARANRSFMQRAVRELAGAGFTQFLDIGTGIPTSPNLHQVAQAVAPQARVVYVDNDPVVLTHARALLTSTTEGRTAYVEGDILEPDGILHAPELAGTLDLSRPVALSVNAVLHFVRDDRDPHGIVSRLLDALPTGSALCLSHATADVDPVGIAKVVDVYNAAGVAAQARGQDEVARFFTGLQMVEPGLCMAHRWRPDVTVPLAAACGSGQPAAAPTDAEVSLWAGVGVKQ